MIYPNTRVSSSVHVHVPMSGVGTEKNLITPHQSHYSKNKARKREAKAMQTQIHPPTKKGKD